MTTARRKPAPRAAGEQLKPELLPITVPKPHPRNVMRHDERNIQSIIRSLSKFGQRTPIVLSKRTGYILKGNGTFEAAKALKWKQISCLRADMSEADEYAYMIADNKTGQLSEFDWGVLKDVVRELQEQEYPVEATGFDGFELAPLFAAEDFAPTDPGDAPEDADQGALRLLFNPDEAHTLNLAVQVYITRNGKELSVKDAIVAVCSEYRKPKRK